VVEFFFSARCLRFEKMFFFFSFFGFANRENPKKTLSPPHSPGKNRIKNVKEERKK